MTLNGMIISSFKKPVYWSRPIDGTKTKGVTHAYGYTISLLSLFPTKYDKLTTAIFGPIQTTTFKLS